MNQITEGRYYSPQLRSASASDLRAQFCYNPRNAHPRKLFMEGIIQMLCVE